MISIEQFWNNLLLLQTIKLMTKFDIDLLAHLAKGEMVKFFFQPIYTDYAN